MSDLKFNGTDYLWVNANDSLLEFKETLDWNVFVVDT